MLKAFDVTLDPGYDEDIFRRPVLETARGLVLSGDPRKEPVWSDRVFWGSSNTPGEVYYGLVNIDGYHPEIVVTVAADDEEEAV